MLEHLLAPQGIYVVSTGKGEVGAYLTRRFGSADPEIQRERHLAQIARIPDARVIILGVPMDAGAGFERGSFKGPMHIRMHLLDNMPRWDEWRERGVVDIGDVRVHPQLTDDEAHSEKLLQSVRMARRWDTGPLITLPVAPHSILKRVLQRIRELNPTARVMLLGGDHSISRLPVEVLTEDSPQDLGILHFDAHTDLLSAREGFPYSFAAWAYQANDRIGRAGRLVQVGIRASGQPRAAWEQELDVRQLWSPGDTQDADAAQARILDLFEQAGVKRVYISNDIDATDPAFAAATGTLEPDGLHPDAVVQWINAVAQRFDVIGADLVEVAPPLKNNWPGEPGRTLDTAARYVAAQIEALLNAPHNA